MSSESSSNYSGSDTESSTGSDSYDYTDSSSAVASSRFYETVIDTTLAARARRREKFRGSSKPLLTRSRYIRQVRRTIEHLVDDILHDWKRKVVDASAKGYSNVNLFEYSKGEKYEGLPIVLLMNGPRDDSDFFKNHGLFSVVEDITSYIASEGFRVEYKFVGKGVNVINVDWRSGLFDAE